jgi:hypothetical protein
MISWPSKDPGATLDFVYHIPLDAGDSIANIGDVTFTPLSGTVTVPSKSLASSPTTTTDANGVAVFGQDLTVWLSGGADGETDIFEVAWTTVNSRTNDDIIMLAVVSKNVPALVLTGYVKPTPAHLAIKYPAFASVDAETVQFWLTDAERFVGTSWSEGDYAAGLMALAAHNMALAGYGADPSLASIPAGATSFRMGPLQISMTPQAANAKLAGDLTSTRYGVEFTALQRRNVGGPLIAPTGVPVDCLDRFAPFGWLF